MLVSQSHEGADRRRRRIEDRDLVPLDHLPEAVRGRRGRRALVHEGGGAVEQRPVDAVGVARHPTHVGGAPVDVVLFQVEDPARGQRGGHPESAGGVQDALRLPGRTRGVEDEQRVLALDPLGLALGGLLRHHVVPGNLLVVQVDRLSDPVEDDDLLHRRRALQGVMHVVQQRHHRALPPATVGGDQHLRARVVHAITERFGREAAEHHRVHRADPRARQHGHRRLGNQRQVDRHPVALLHAERLEPVREAADLGVQLTVRQRPPIPRLALEDEGDLVPTLLEVPIEAVVREVGLPLDEPLRVRRLPLERGLERLLPEELLARTRRPPALWITLRLVIETAVILHALDVSALREPFGRREDALLCHDRMDLFRVHAHVCTSETMIRRDKA